MTLMKPAYRRTVFGSARRGQQRKTRAELRNRGTLNRRKHGGLTWKDEGRLGPREQQRRTLSLPQN